MKMTMTWRALAFMAVTFLLPGFLSSASNEAQASGEPSTPVATQSSRMPVAVSDDENQIRKQANDFANAFAAGDATSIANMWTEDCSYTDAEGDRHLGRPAVLSLYQQFFHDGGAQPIAITIESLTFPAPNVCLEEGTSGLPRALSSSRYSVVHVKRDGNWKMLQVVETNCRPVVKDSLKDLNWLIGEWSAKSKEKTVRLQVNPVAHGNFLALKYLAVPGDDKTPEDLQIIGWSPRLHKIVSWHYGANGGFGFGEWSRTKDGWINRTHGVLPDGAESAASYIISHPDANHFTWQSVMRTVNGERLNDSGSVQATREQTEVKSTAPSL